MNKTKSIRVRLTDDELAHAEAASLKLFGTHNKSRLIRKLVRDYIGLGPDLPNEALKEFRLAVRQLTGIARNLNQITAKIHQSDNHFSHLSESYLVNLKEHVVTVNFSLQHYIQRTIIRYQEAVNHEQY